MRRPPILAAAALAAIAALLIGCPGGAARPRNVLLLTIDTLRVDRVGAFGSTRGLTPNLDRLAEDGVRFTRAYTPIPLTTPSHATMLTGRYPITHGLRNNGSEVLSGKETLLSEMLRERGFRTAGIVSALVLASQFGLNQGFDLYYEEGIQGSEAGHGLWYDQRRADKTVDRAVQWLRAEGDRPFFLWVHLFDPHEPYDPPPPFKDAYEKTPYDGEVAFADAQAGRLLDALRELKLYDDTLVVMAGDHGEGLGEHREQYHAVFVYDTTMHVPLIVKAPGGRRGAEEDDLATTMDIAPTVLEALGMEGAQPMDGVSLLPSVMRGERVPARSLHLESVYASASYGWAEVRGLVSGSWKMIALPAPELYDRSADPRETTNAWLSEPARASEMRAELDKLEAELEQGARATESAPLDDETRNRLLSLGYVAGERSKARRGKGADPKDLSFMILPLNVAGKFMEKKLYADAEAIYEKALERDPENKIALIRMGQALASQGRLAEAVPHFERAIATYPDGEEFYRAYGRVLLAAGRPADARGVFTRALEQLPESGHMHFMLGYTRFLERDWAGAEPELELAVRLSPRFGKPHYLMAICRLQRGDESGALASLASYLERDADVDSLFNDPYLTALRERPAFQAMLRKHL